MNDIKKHKIKSLGLINNDMEEAEINTIEGKVSRLGINSEKKNYYNRLYSEEVMSFLKSYPVLGKYECTVFIEKTQTDVYLKTEQPLNGKKKIFPGNNDIYIWLVSEDYINYDTSFIKIQLGRNTANDFKKREISQSFLEKFILEQIKRNLGFNPYSEKDVNDEVNRSLQGALLWLSIVDDLNSDVTLKEVFNTNPCLYLAVKSADFVGQRIEDLKLKENRWNPKVKGEKYNPLIIDSTIDNAIVCGLINGMIDVIKAIPEFSEFLSTLLGSEKEWKKFKEGIKKLFTDKEVLKAFIEAMVEDYKDALEEGNVEKLMYTLAHDSLAIVSILIGIHGLVKGVASFINFIGKAFKYIRRYGRKGINKLKKLKPKQIEEVFDDIDNVHKNLDSLRLSKLELDEWIKVIRRLGADVKHYKVSKKMTRYFEVENPNVGAAFNANDKPPTIWIRDNPTDLELFHESMHLEDFFRRGKFNYTRGQKREMLPFGNKPQVPKKDQLISKYIKEKYVLDKILEEQQIWIKKFGKGRFTEQDIQFSIDYFNEVIVKELIKENIDISKIVIK